MQTLMLASASPWRRRMLESAGVQVVAEASGVDEREIEASLEDAGPADVASALAVAKARAVAARHPGSLVLGADQVMWDGHEVIGKPSSPADHLSRLQSLRGRPHELFTGWCLVQGDEVVRMGVTRTRLFVRDDLEDAELEAYVDGGEGSGCAGGYAIEGHGAWLFEWVDGDWNNIIGLPLFDLLTALRSLGFRYGARHG